MSVDMRGITALLSLPLRYLLCRCPQAAIAASVVPGTPAWG